MATGVGVEPLGREQAQDLSWRALEERDLTGHRQQRLPPEGIGVVARGGGEVLDAERHEVDALFHRPSLAVPRPGRIRA